MIDYTPCRVYNNVLWLCIKNDISIKKMLETIKIGKNVLSNIRGGTNPQLKSLIAICNYFDVSLDQLVAKRLCSSIPKKHYDSKFMVREDFKNEKTTRTTS